MKRLLLLALIMGGFYLTMASFSSADQKPKADVSNITAPDSADAQDEYSDYDRDDLKEGLMRAYYDVLMSSKDDIENNDLDGAENDGISGQPKIVGPDGKERTLFQEARRTIFEADRVYSRVKEENRRAMIKLQNPPRRILPRRKPAKQPTVKQQIEAQEKRIVKEQRKLEELKQTLETQTAEK